MSTPTKPRLYRLAPWLVRAVVPDAVAGSYTLFSDATAVYTGRSDTDLRRRLLNHAHYRRAEYFDFDSHTGPHGAFLVECATYHAVGPGLRNRIHPGAPAGSGETCPFCRSTALATITGRLSPQNLLQETGAPRPITN